MINVLFVQNVDLDPPRQLVDLIAEIQMVNSEWASAFREQQQTIQQQQLQINELQLKVEFVLKEISQLKETFDRKLTVEILAQTHQVIKELLAVVDNQNLDTNRNCVGENVDQNIVQTMNKKRKFDTIADKYSIKKRK